MDGSYAEKIYKSFYLLDRHPRILGKDNNLLLEMTVPRELINVQGAIHGGALATIIDAATTLVLLKVDNEKLRRHVSVELNLSFLSPALLHDKLLINAECQRMGRTIAFTTCEIYKDMEDFKLVSNGRHIKAVMNEPFNLE
jgi:acyl-coenzyme A thioesterase 13